MATPPRRRLLPILLAAAALVTFASHGLLQAAESPAAGAAEPNTPRELTPADLTVHEWGVFCVFNDSKYANANLKQEWASVPECFYRLFPTRRLPYRGPVEKPILYFYTDRPGLDLRVKVSFPGGVPVVWWPCAERPADYGRGPGKKEEFHEIEWSGWLGTSPPWGQGAAVAAPANETPMPVDSWVNLARIKGPAPFTVMAGEPGMRKGAMRPLARETERFAYYDGLVTGPDYLRVLEATDESVTVKSSAAFPIGGLLLMDRRAAGKDGTLGFARIDKLDVNGQAKVAWKRSKLDAWPAEAARVLREDIVKAGLFEAEANSVLDIWKAGLFDRPGIAAIYLLPQAEYDRMLPLSVTPKPPKVVRVGIVLHGCLEGDAAVARKARELIPQLDDASVAVRDRASRELMQLGPSALPILREALSTAASAEVKARLKDVIDKTDATEYAQ